MDFVVDYFECGMIGLKEVAWIVEIPDGVALIDLSKIDHDFGRIDHFSEFNV